MYVPFLFLNLKCDIKLFPKLFQTIEDGTANYNKQGVLFRCLKPFLREKIILNINITGVLFKSFC